MKKFYVGETHQHLKFGVIFLVYSSWLAFQIWPLIEPNHVIFIQGFDCESSHWVFQLSQVCVCIPLYFTTLGVLQ